MWWMKLSPSATNCSKPEQKTQRALAKSLSRCSKASLLTQFDPVFTLSNLSSSSEMKHTWFTFKKWSQNRRTPMKKAIKTSLTTCSIWWISTLYEDASSFSIKLKSGSSITKTKRQREARLTDLLSKRKSFLTIQTSWSQSPKNCLWRVVSSNL